MEYPSVSIYIHTEKHALTKHCYYLTTRYLVSKPPTPNQPQTGKAVNKSDLSTSVEMTAIPRTDPPHCKYVVTGYLG